jgi:hypothetical protein
MVPAPPFGCADGSQHPRTVLTIQSIDLSICGIGGERNAPMRGDIRLGGLVVMRRKRRTAREARV